MAARSRSTTRINLPLGWGDAAIAPCELLKDYPCRSYDSCGSGLGWIPPSGSPLSACDTEVDSVERRLLATVTSIPEDSFLRCWTIAEVVAKLTETPVICLVKQGFLKKLFDENRGGNEITLSRHGVELTVLYQYESLDGRHVAFGRQVA